MIAYYVCSVYINAMVPPFILCTEDCGDDEDGDCDDDDEDDDDER